MPKIAKFVGAPLLSMLRGRKDLDVHGAAKIDKIADQRGEAFSAATRSGAANSPKEYCVVPIVRPAPRKTTKATACPR